MLTGRSLPSSAGRIMDYQYRKQSRLGKLLNWQDLTRLRNQDFSSLILMQKSRLAVRRGKEGQ